MPAGPSRLAPATSPTSITIVDLRGWRREPLPIEVPGLELRLLDELPARTGALRDTLTVVVHGGGEEQQATAAAVWSQAASVPVVTVELGANGTRIGPLTVPGRVGCAHCAHQRIRAAAALQDDGPAHSSTDLGRVGELLSGELAVVSADPLRSSLLDHVLAWDGAGGEPTRHRVVPLAGCPVCGGAVALGQQAEQDGDPLAGWVDPVTGVIPALQVDQFEGSGLPAVVTAAAPHVIDEDGSLRALPAGWGKGLTLADALRSAVGEAIERYSASLPDPSRLVWARPGELDGEQLDPRLFPLYRADQYARPGFPYVPFDPTVAHPWVHGSWLGGGDVWAPGLLAFLSLTVNAEHLVCQGSSNGLAAWTDWDEAALRAVLELVERDALMAGWLTGAPGLRLEPDASLDPALHAIVEGIEAMGATVELYLLPESVCGTTILCLTLGDGVTWPGATVALAADLDPRAAVQKALLELGQTGPYLRELLHRGTPEPPRREADVRTMLDHATFYFSAERASAFAPLRAGEGVLPFEALADWDGERSLEACASALERAGIRVALVDVTAADVATGPFRVARALSPDLQPISYGFGLERLPVERIRARAEHVDPPAIHPIW